MPSARSRASRSDPSTALSKTKSGDDFVKFTNTDGTAKVTVKAKGGQLAIKARAKQLSDLLGDGCLVGRRLRDRGQVDRRLHGRQGQRAGTRRSPLGPFRRRPASPGRPARSRAQDNPGHAKPGVADKDKAAVATADGTFAWQGFTKRLPISVKVVRRRHGQPGDHPERARRPEADRDPGRLAGARTWSAHLCDGTAVSGELPRRLRRDGRL